MPGSDKDASFYKGRALTTEASVAAAVGSQSRIFFENDLT